MNSAGATADVLPAPEVPVALVYNGISHAVMLACPSDLEEFALGFSFTEGIIDNSANILDTELHEQERGIEVAISISNRCMAALRDQRRSMTGRSGCGLCGTESLDTAVRKPATVADGARLSSTALNAAVEQLARWQAPRPPTAGLHRAAWCDLASGALHCVREDVGRHNALDKLIGALLREHADANDGFVLLSSRASYEMVQKAARFGAQIVVAVSAPTTLAIDCAERAGLTLVAQARNGRYNVLTHAGRITD